MIGLLAVAVPLAAGRSPSAGAQSAPCDVAAPAFSDISGNVHAPAIACLAGRGFTQGGPGGLPAHRYGPALETSRAQMASFIARMAEALGVVLSHHPIDLFDDDAGSPHEHRTNQLAGIGVIGGNGEIGRSYFGSRTINRGEMASFLNGLVGVVTGSRLRSTTDAFPDDGTSPYRADIDGLAAAGIVQGRLDGTYGPGDPVRRDSMASFLIRTFLHLPRPPDGPCPMFPADNYWHADVRGLPAHPQSATWLASIGLDRTLHADFGSGTWDGGPIGIPFVVVPASQPSVPISFYYPDESDPGPYPIPPNPPIEGGPDSDGDRHILMVQEGTCRLSEVFDAHPAGGGAWEAGSGAVWDLRSNALRPAGWTSADAAGLPILPGLVRYEEVAAGVVDHALRFTVSRTQNRYLWPARHQAGQADPSLPPMGTWVRLRADIDPATFPPQARPIVVAMQVHGMLLADNGSSVFVSGVPDERWDNDQLRSLRRLTAADFTVVDASGLQVHPDSGAVRR